ncbi:MAG: response regulator [Cyclobacteriaceae bacterium]
MNLEILIVDDDEVVLLIHKAMIAEYGLPKETGAFRNGKQTLEYLLSNNQRDKNILIFLDINMPLMNGWELLEAIEEHNLLSNIYVIMVTSSINPADKAKSSEFDKIIDFVEKPLSEDVIAKIKENEVLKSWL